MAAQLPSEMKRLSIWGGAVTAAAFVGAGAWLRRSDGAINLKICAPMAQSAVAAEVQVADSEPSTVTSLFADAGFGVGIGENRPAIWDRIDSIQSPQDFKETLDGLLGSTDSEAIDLQQLLVRKWSESDPEGAAAWVSRMEPGFIRSAALRQVAVGWANTDLAGATRWVRSMPDGEEKSRAALDVGYEAARTDPMASLTLGGALSPSKERDELLVHAVGQWTGSDPTGARAWADAVADPALRDQLLAAVAVAVADVDGPAAADLVSRSLSPGEEQDRAAVSIVQRWAAEDPPAVADWVSHFPDSDIRDVALRNVVQVWLERDMDAAGEWVRSLPEGSLREEGVKMYESMLAESEEDVILGQPKPKPSNPNTIATKPR